MSDLMKSIVDWWRNSHPAIKIVAFGILALPQLFAIFAIGLGTIDIVGDFLEPDPDIDGFGRAIVFVATLFFVFIFNIPAVLTGFLLRAWGNQFSKRMSFLLFLSCFLYNSIMAMNLLMMTYGSWNSAVEFMIFMIVVFIVSVFPPFQYARKKPSKQ